MSGPVACGFGIDGGECTTCEIDRLKRERDAPGPHSEGCLRRWPTAQRCSCIERKEAE